MPILAGPDVSIDDSRDLYIEYQQASSSKTGASSGTHRGEDVVKAKIETTAPLKFGPHVTIYDPGIAAFLRGEI
jgi:hypothetical protein